MAGIPISFVLFCILQTAIQLLAAIPWSAALDFRLRQWYRSPAPWLRGLALAVVGGGAMSFFLNFQSDPDILARVGRVWMSILHLQLFADGLVLLFWLMLRFWPKGGAVALAAFREGLRQPMFWLLVALVAVLMFLSVYMPYYTFGEDLKVLRELSFTYVMFSAFLFGVIASSMSVHEEIEGRTAVTLMSKPISRRQFLLGKFAGIYLGSAVMTILLGWWMVWMVQLKQVSDPSPTSREQKISDPEWITSALQAATPEGLERDFVRGELLRVQDVVESSAGLVLGSCQVMVLVAVSVMLATRLPMVVNLTLCFLVYFLGHLTQVLVEVTRDQYALVHFVARVFETVLPVLDLFDPGSAIIRDLPLPPREYAWYVAGVAGYAILYSAIALVVGLILFEDKDLA